MRALPGAASALAGAADKSLVSSHCNFETPTQVTFAKTGSGRIRGTADKKSFLQAFTRAGIHHKSSAAASCRCDTN
jgi:hypothetical protein